MRGRSTADKSRDTSAFQVRLPGFATEQEIGLGDMIKRATTALGIKPCGGCSRRASALNQRFVFTSRRRT
jgi:hypothetical protein